MTEDVLFHFLERKKSKLAQLHQVKDDIDFITKTLTSENRKRTYSNIKNRIKRILFWFLALSLFLTSITLMLFSQPFAKEIANSGKFVGSVSEQVNAYHGLTKPELYHQVKQYRVAEFGYMLGIASIYLLGISLIIFIKRTHLGQLIRRHKETKNANRLSHELLKGYREFIKEEEREFKEIEKMYKSLKKDSSPS